MSNERDDPEFGEVSCRHCGTRVERRAHKSHWRPKPNQTYWFEWWDQCPNKECNAVYMYEAAKVYRSVG